MLELFLQYVWVVSWGVAIILIVIYGYFCGWKIFKAYKEIERVSNAQDLVATVKESDLLKPFWIAFEKTLTTVGDNIYSTIDASEIFNRQNLTRGLNMTFWQNYGGIFTGLGIFGTFAGLTFGLTGVDMTSDNIKVLQDGVKKLLSGVESAFVTSLVGIGCAIVYNVVHHRLIKKFQDNVQRLAYKLDEKFSRRSVEDLLADTYTETQEQTTVLKNIGEQVAQAIHNALDEKLADYVESICAAINQLGAGGSNKIGEIFSARVGTQMERFSNALDRFSDNINEKLKTSNEISKLMNEQMLTTLKELTETLQQDRANREATDVENINRNRKVAENFESLVAKLIADLKNFTDWQQKFLSSSTNSNTAQISGAVNAFSEIVTRHNSVTQKTFAQIQKLLDQNENFLLKMEATSTTLKQAAEPVKQSTLQLTRNLTETSAQMKNLSAANQMTRQNLSDLTARLKDFVMNFNGIADELEGSTKIIHDSLKNYNVMTSKELTSKLDAFDKSMADAIGYLKSLMEELSDVLEDFNRKRR